LPLVPGTVIEGPRRARSSDTCDCHIRRRELRHVEDSYLKGGERGSIPVKDVLRSWCLRGAGVGRRTAASVEATCETRSAEESRGASRAFRPSFGPHIVAAEGFVVLRRYITGSRSFPLVSAPAAVSFASIRRLVKWPCRRICNGLESPLPGTCIACLGPALRRTGSSKPPVLTTGSRRSLTEARVWLLTCTERFVSHPDSRPAKRSPTDVDRFGHSG
jgi:hypothetical protein